MNENSFAVFGLLAGFVIFKLYSYWVKLTVRKNFKSTAISDLKCFDGNNIDIDRLKQWHREACLTHNSATNIKYELTAGFIVFVFAFGCISLVMLIVEANTSPVGTTIPEISPDHVILDTASLDTKSTQLIIFPETDATLDSIAEENKIESTSHFLTIIFYSFPLFFYFLYLYTNRNVFRNCIQLRQNQFRDVWRICNNLADKIGLSHYTMNIYLLKDNSFTAATFVRKKTIHLILSRNIFSESEQNIKEVESLIGHEFGHALLKDSKILLANRKLFSLFFVIASITAVNSLFLNFSLTYIAQLSFILSTYKETIFNRNYSEHLADLTSLLYVQDSKIISLIHNLPDSENNLLYPDKHARLAFLEKQISIFRKQT
jgi:hypothetical protein